MSNQFFKKSGPFNIDELLKINDIINTSNLKNTKILDIKDLTIANEHNKAVKPAVPKTIACLDEISFGFLTK